MTSAFVGITHDAKTKITANHVKKLRQEILNELKLKDETGILLSVLEANHIVKGDDEDVVMVQLHTAGAQKKKLEQVVTNFIRNQNSKAVIIFSTFSNVKFEEAFEEEDEAEKKPKKAAPKKSPAKSEKTEIQEEERPKRANRGKKKSYSSSEEEESEEVPKQKPKRKAPVVSAEKKSPEKKSPEKKSPKKAKIEDKEEAPAPKKKAKEGPKTAGRRRRSKRSTYDDMLYEY